MLYIGLLTSIHLVTINYIKGLDPGNIFEFIYWFAWFVSLALVNSNTWINLHAHSLFHLLGSNKSVGIRRFSLLSSGRTWVSRPK